MNPTAISKNLSAFLSMISWAEGTANIPGSDNGYRVIVGSTPMFPKLFHDYSDHPRIRVWIEKINNHSTAAGRYQILERYYDAYKKTLRLPDFSPSSQDAIAIQMIKERRALDLIEQGKIKEAIVKVKKIWASFPNAGYRGQKERGGDDLLLKFLSYGGSLAKTV
jgi:muramidase (phage lysozyme)